MNGAILAGGGMRTGQVIGSTDSIAGEAKNDPIHYPNVLATVYNNLGLDPHGMVYDVSNRPNPILPSTRAGDRQGLRVKLERPASGQRRH